MQVGEQLRTHHCAHLSRAESMQHGRPGQPFENQIGALRGVDPGYWESKFVHVDHHRRLSSHVTVAAIATENALRVESEDIRIPAGRQELQLSHTAKPT